MGCIGEEGNLTAVCLQNGTYHKGRAAWLYGYVRFWEIEIAHRKDIL